MIVVDTNVISELWKAQPARQVQQWMDSQMIETLHLAATTVAELRFGLAVMPPSRRRTILTERLESEVLPAFAGRVLPFDLAATQAYAQLMTKTRQAGLTLGMADAYIAASAAARTMAVATRDTGPFVAAGLSVIDPWAEG